MSQKASDLSAIPLCWLHHRESKDSYHKLGKRFFEHHGLDVVRITEELNDIWTQAKAA